MILDSVTVCWKLFQFSTKGMHCLAWLPEFIRGKNHFHGVEDIKNAVYLMMLKQHQSYLASLEAEDAEMKSDQKPKPK